MADFSELLKKRRSIRAFEDKSVSTDTLKEIINDAIIAPSSSNEQTWRFSIVNNMELMKKLSDESKANILKTIRENPQSGVSRYETVLASEKFNVFYNAPALVIISGPKGNRSTLVNCALAASYFMLSAANRGLGTCWVNLGADIRSPELLDAIGIPNDCTIVAPIIVGYPKFIPDVTPRNEPIILKIVE